MSDPYLYYKSIKDTPVCGHLDFNCLKFKYEVLKLGVWMSDPYLYYNSIKDPHVCGHLDFNCQNMESIMTSYCSSLPLAIQYPLGDVLF